MKKQKTFHKQSGKFLGVIAEHMPEISSDLMQEFIRRPTIVGMMMERMFRFAMEQSNFFDKRFSEISVNADDSTIYSNASLKTLLQNEQDGGPFQEVFIDPGVNNEFPRLNLYAKKFTAQAYKMSLRYDNERRSIFDRIVMATMQGIYKAHNLYGACLVANKIAEKNLVEPGESMIIFTPHLSYSNCRVISVIVSKGMGEPKSAKPMVDVRPISFDEFKFQVEGLHNAHFVF